MAGFADTLNYSASNEDGRCELRALELTEVDTVVCITGSGGRTLDLLTAGPRRIFSVDMIPCQGFLMELKLSAALKGCHTMTTCGSWGSKRILAAWQPMPGSGRS